jgi:site-specific recombinase XerD
LSPATEVASVVVLDGGHRLQGRWDGTNNANRFLDHLDCRRFSPATIRAYAYDVVCLARFLDERSISLEDVVATDLFDWIDWQSRQRPSSGKVVAINAPKGAAASSVNRRVAAVRAFFEFQVMSGALRTNPVPAARRSSGLRATPRGMLGHIGRRRAVTGGRLVREAKRLPEALDLDDVNAFTSSLGTHRDRAIVFIMLFGGLRAGEVRSLLLCDVDMGMRRLRVSGKGGKERVVPVERVFFSEVAAYLHDERPQGCATPECFVVLRGPTAGSAMTEAGLRSIFRTHRALSGASRVRPHRLRHTYGTELASAGVDLLVLRELMGHASPETTAAYVHLSPDTLAAAYEQARQAIEQ